MTMRGTDRGVATIGERITSALSRGPLTFEQLRERISTVRGNVLSGVLKRMAEAGEVEKRGGPAREDTLWCLVQTSAGPSLADGLRSGVD